MFEAARPEGESAESCEQGVQGLAPAGILFPHFLLLEKENGRDRRGNLNNRQTDHGRAAPLVSIHLAELLLYFRCGILKFIV